MKRALPAPIRSLNERARALMDRGRWRQAAPLLRRSVRLTERRFGPDALALWEPLNDLGVCYKFLARLSDAGPLYQRALAIVERHRGRRHSDVATLYHNLGGLEHAAGNWRRGEPFARRAVAIRTHALGPAHHLVARDMIALAALLDPQKKDGESERLYARAIAILERECGPEDPEIAVALNNLAAVHQARGRPRQAESAYRRAVDLAIRQLGPDHPKVAFYTNNLAALLQSRRRFAEAAELYKRAHAVFNRTLGPNHPNVALCLDNYASVLRRLKRRHEADRLARRAERILGRLETMNDQTDVAPTATINPQFAGFRLAVRPSRINRFGVFADESIPRGRKVIEYTGERISRREAYRRVDAKSMYLFRLNSYWRLDGAFGGSGAEFINHSCEPNLHRRYLRGDHIMLFSSKAIDPGEELTLDYRYHAESKLARCRCGAPTCRGTINLFATPSGARRALGT